MPELSLPAWGGVNSAEEVALTIYNNLGESGLFTGTQSGLACLRAWNSSGDSNHRDHLAFRAHSFIGVGAYISCSDGTGLQVECDPRKGNKAAEFWGDVHIHGNVVSHASTILVIDHPLAPDKQFLQHAYVGSSERKNIYDGVVRLDENGEATVALPGWLCALNDSFRYQLTCIGAHAPVYIKEQVSTSNQFLIIAGGVNGLIVSWQLTGTLKDQFVQDNPLTVEANKCEEDLGKYISPALYGKGLESAISRPIKTNEANPSRSA
jgi:hypothetical protein